MSWYYTQMVQAHVILAWCSIGLFAFRGLSSLLGKDWASDGRVLLLVFMANALVTVSGLSLWALMHYTPLRDSWLLAKLIALAVYLFAAHLALGQGPWRVPAYITALLSLAYMLGVSMTRSAALVG